MSTPVKSNLDENKMNAFLGKVVGDFGAIATSALVVLGDKLGLYRALAEHGPLNSTELAQKTNTQERYVREWLINQAASGYIEYDSKAGRYSMTPEQATALTDDTSPFCVVGGFQVLTAMLKADRRIMECFQKGGGMLWGEHDADLFTGTERFFKASYIGFLVGAWIPALDGVKEKLEAGGVVADIGCGHGASTILMARAFPKSRFYGFDNHPPSIQHATETARAEGLTNITFVQATATQYPNHQYDLVAFFDCLHDMGDPVGAARQARETLKSDGTVLMVEPMAGRKLEENFNPVGRIYAAASTLCCTPNAVASGPMALGTVASDDDLKAVFTSAGFTRFRRAAETPFNRVFEVRP
jgi:SAM-dependent methyltransferase